MAREIIWTDPAWDDIQAAAEYIARDSDYYAAAFVLEVREADESLREMAERGQIVPEFQDPHIRELLIGSYRLIYHLMPEQVAIVAVVHGARRLWRI